MVLEVEWLQRPEEKSLKEEELKVEKN